MTVEETQKITAKKIEITASQEILLTCGSSSIRLNKDLIRILSDLVRINC
ncbi:DUF2345 domain-containing protein [Diaphorobacter aerolatus]|nr:DUF2345 domain-containing protein [Diaphorobacter aerolatus]